jgi:hypothetical protein
MYSDYIIGTVLSDPRVCNYPINREIIYRVFQILVQAAALSCQTGFSTVLSDTVIRIRGTVVNLTNN